MSQPKTFESFVMGAAMLLCLLIVLLAAFCTPAHGQTAGATMPWVRPQFLDNNGLVVATGKVCTYAAGTTTPQVTYQDSALVTPNANPVVLDISGRPVNGVNPVNIYLAAQNYKFVLMSGGNSTDCSTGTTIWTQDNIEDVGQVLKANLATAGASTGAALVGFTQTGTGAVAMTVQTKLRQIVNVADYGAAGDGTTDDTTALKNAIAHVSTGGEVRFNPGTYLVSCVGCAANSSVLTPSSGVRLACGGKGAVTIKLAASSPQSVGILGGTGLSRVVVDGCTFDGNKASQTNGQFGIFCFDCDHWVVTNNRFQNFTATPVNFGWSSTGSFDNIVADNEFSAWGQTNSAFGAIFIGTPKRNILHHNTFNCSSTSNTGFSFDGSDDLGLASTGLNNVADHNIVNGCVIGAIIEDADYSVMDANEFIGQLGTAGVAGYGILVQEGQIHHKPVGSRITNNVISGLVTATFTGACVNVNEADDDLIQGNLCTNATNAIGINLGASGTHLPSVGHVVSLNTIDTVSSTGIFVQEGTDHVIAQNVIRNLTGASGQAILLNTTTANPLNRISVLGNTISTVSQAGVEVAISNNPIQNVTIANNTFTNVGFGGGAAHSNAITLLSGVANAMINNNRCVDTQGTPTTNNCVASDASSTLVQAYGDEAFGISGSLYSLSTATTSNFTVAVPLKTLSTSTLIGGIGVPATIKGFVSDTVTVIPGGIAANTCVSSGIAVAGASDSAFSTSAQPLAALGSTNLVWTAYGTVGGGSVTLVICNPTAAPITPNNVNWRFTQVQ